MLTQLCRLGLTTDEDTQIVLQELAKDDRAMSAIEELKALPKRLQHHLEALLDKEGTDAWQRPRIRNVLLARARG